ncbi:MAG: hypothetical protein HYY00_03465 [Chloroflexi bacterium]|nr:hypothetical protein [Chloroflexota bacterium]
METILVTGAGGGGGNNLITDIRLGAPDVRIIGANMDPHVLGKSVADVNYLLPPATSKDYIQALNWVIRKERVQLSIPDNDREVRAQSENREHLACPVFLPPKESVRICQDKFLLYEALRKADIPMAETMPVTTLEDLGKIFAHFNGHDRLWVRMRRTSGSRGSIPVPSADYARWWISYWCEMRGARVDDFTVSEYLPGRDFAFQSTWFQGRLVVAKLCERLSYFFGQNMPSGSSSTPAVAKRSADLAIFEIGLKTVKAVDAAPHGNYCMDFRCNKDGVPCVTEINSGRFFMITPIFDRAGLNMASTFVRMGLGGKPPVWDLLERMDNVYMLRDLDTEPTIITEEGLAGRFQKAGDDASGP